MMYEIGLISIGALATLVALCAFVAYLARGHRIDLTQLRALNVWEDINRRKAFGPWRLVDKSEAQSAPEPNERIHGGAIQHGARTVRERGGDDDD